MPVWVFSRCIQPQSTVGGIFGRLIRDSELAEKVNVRMDIFLSLSDGPSAEC